MAAFIPVLLILLTAARTVDGQVYGSSIANSQFDCTGKEDGIAEIGCDGSLECKNGQAIKQFCGDFEYFNRDTLSCISTTGHSTGCSHFNVCKGRTDGRYADPERNCQTYYTCHNAFFYGHQYCPGGLVFNEDLQLCDWPNNVLFPCGTKMNVTIVG